MVLGDSQDRQRAIAALQFLDAEIGRGGIAEMPLSLRFVAPEPNTLGHGLGSRRLEVFLGPQIAAQFAQHDEFTPKELTPEWAQLAVADAVVNIKNGTYKVRIGGSGAATWAYLTFGFGKLAATVWVGFA